MVTWSLVVIQLDVEIRQDELVLDELPDDAGHLVAVHLDYWICYLDFRHEASWGCGAVAREGGNFCEDDSKGRNRHVKRLTQRCYVLVPAFFVFRGALWRRPDVRLNTN
jgi:hypothetical protein